MDSRVNMGVNYGVCWCEYGVTPTPSGGVLKPQTPKPSTEYPRMNPQVKIEIEKANVKTSRTKN